MTRLYTPDYVLAATSKMLSALLPLLKRSPGPVADAAIYASYRKTLLGLLGDTRAAARSASLADDLATVFSGYRRAASDMRAVITGLSRVAVAARAVAFVDPRSDALLRQRQNEQALSGLCEWLALAEQAHAVADLTPASFDEAKRLRIELAQSFDLALERASDWSLTEILPALRQTQAKLVRDLIERGRPLARIVRYEAAMPLPAVVLAHRLYQDAGRTEELMAFNPTPHPSFMPLVGQAMSR